MRLKWNQPILLTMVVAILLSACSPQRPAPAPVKTSSSTVPTRTTTATIPPIGSLTPIATPALSTPTPTQEPRPVSARPPSGWTIYSNPDFVQGVAVQGRTLWSATLGGVVAWNLDTDQPTLYTTRDGLAEIQGNDVVYCPAPDDRIFVAHTTGVISSYDLSLNKWSRVPITFDDGSTFTVVQTLFCDMINRRLMAGSPDGLAILDMKTGHWRRIGNAEGLKVGTVRGIDVVGQAIWVAAGDKSAFMILGNTVFPFDSASGFPSGRVNDLSVAPDSSIWFGYSTGLVHYQDKKWSSYGAQTSSGIPFQSVDRVQVSPDKHIWIASAEEGLCPFDPVTLTCSSIYSGIHDAPITDLAVSSDGVAYAGTDGGGILVLAPNQVNHLTFNHKQLLSNDVMDITGGPDGHLWIATDRGVNILDPAHAGDPWQTLTAKPNQLAYARVSGLLPVSNGMWFFYDQEPLISLLNGDKWLQFDSNKGISGPVIDAEMDKRGYVWFATPQGIKAWDGSIMRAYTPPDDLGAGNVRSLLSTEDGGMWVGTDRGLLRYQRFQWIRVLPDIPVNSIISDDNGGLLLGTDQGLIRFDGAQSFLWIFNLGDEVVRVPKVTSVARDGSGRLWVGTAGQGLFYYDGKNWERFNTASGLPTDIVRKIFTDPLGAVWIAAITGEGGGALVRFVP